MDPYYPSSTKRSGIPDLLDWEVSDNKRARLGLGEESETQISCQPFELFRPDGHYNDQTPPDMFGLASGSSFAVLDNCLEAPEVCMSDAQAPWMDSAQCPDFDWQCLEPQATVEMICFGMVCGTSFLGLHGH
jgi:hypothetical protein